jgi:SAM-dependent methyltransferase
LRSKTLKTAQNPYDVVAYPGRSYPDTHPNTLATMAILHGLSPAPVARCRVLEVACGDGANLIPMAYASPESEFAGFDLAAEPIARGQARIRELGLRNVRLFEGDLLDASLDARMEPGRFDYIVAHGIYTWAPAAVGDRVLALCGKLLAEDGVAFVSYNALPGGHLRLMLRDMMLFRAQGTGDLLEQVEEGMAFLRFVCESRHEDDTLRSAIESQLKRMEKRGPAVVRHDEMSDVYQPVSFTQMVEHAQRHGLQYLCEATLPPPPDPAYRADIQASLDNAAGRDLLRKEQLMDFLRLRMYRETLLCRAGRTVRRDYPAESFRRLLFASQAVAVEGETPGATAFVLPSGVKMESTHPNAKALLTELGKAWPHALSLEELAPRMAGAGVALDAQGLALLVRMAIARMIEFRAWNPPLVRTISERPRASAVSRRQARAGENATSLLHRSIGLEDAKLRTLLRLLDGTRARAELLDAMAAELEGSSLEELESGLNSSIENFYRAGIFEA